MTCEHCGANEYYQDNWSRIIGENQRLRAELEKQYARLAIVEARHKIEELERDERRSWEQGKVHRQQQRITELEQERTERLQQSRSRSRRGRPARVDETDIDFDPAETGDA